MIVAMRSKILKFNAFSHVWHTPNMVIASAARLDRFRLREGLWMPLRGVKWTGEARQLQFLVLVETTSKRRQPGRHAVQPHPTSAEGQRFLPQTWSESPLRRTQPHR